MVSVQTKMDNVSYVKYKTVKNVLHLLSDAMLAIKHLSQKTLSVYVKKDLLNFKANARLARFIIVCLVHLQFIKFVENVKISIF